jgi:nicotinate phosphoribosyltransferase
MHDEKPDFTKPLELFDPKAPWKRSVQEDYKAVELLRPIFKNGKRVYDLPSLEEIRKYCAEQIDLLWDTVKRFDYPHEYYVDLSQKLWDLKNDMLRNQK